ncbi:hypothetical protein [Bacillus massiliigorillae]|nr:hypothetical protein [Bacillus massiliigorillae]
MYNNENLKTQWEQMAREQMLAENRSKEEIESIIRQAKQHDKY